MLENTTTMHSSLSELWSVVVGQFGIISAAAMAGLTHGAVALPVITGQRLEATPYHTIHKGSHTIHNVYTSSPHNAGGHVAKAWDWGRASSGQE